MSDTLIQLGKTFEDDRKSIKHTSRRVTKLEPIVEKSMDYVGTLYTYTMEFYTYGESSVSLDIKFFEKHKNYFYDE